MKKLIVLVVAAFLLVSVISVSAATGSAAAPVIDKPTTIGATSTALVNVSQTQQQTLQLLANLQKTLNDTLRSVIRRLAG
jgi:hypothetical protein